VKLVLAEAVVSRLTEALLNAGKREIGGIMMGEHVGTNTFRVTDVSVQMDGGTFASFVRIVTGLLVPLRAFFRRTGHNYLRFNYIGEWHSHHSFSLVPSSTDVSTMQDLADDRTLGANFVALLLVSLDTLGKLRGAVTVYSGNTKPWSGLVILEGEDPEIRGTARDMACRVGYTDASRVRSGRPSQESQL
jgi:[CysO sulfur-carrier protein]-S-L-cysteine hydrolase